MANNSDAKGLNSPGEDISLAALKAAKNMENQRKQTLNITPTPTPAKNPITGKFEFLTSPIALPRLFGPALQLAGDPFNFRVTSGFGDIRFTRNPDGSTSPGGRTHGGLDFAAPVGTPVLAVFDGVVSFVGAQKAIGGSKSIPLPTVDGIDANTGKAVNGAGSIYSNGQLVLSSKDVGNGGIFIQLRHDAAFAGFKTEYMHLSKVTVKEGQSVHEGDVIGYTGNTGGRTGVIYTGDHLHFQIRFQEKIVKPEPLIPSTRFTPANTGYAVDAIQLYKEKQPLGKAVAINSVIGTLTALDRATTAAGFERGSILKRAADHNQYLSTYLKIQAARVQKANTEFSALEPRVDKPLGFDFKSGKWNDNGEPV